jgi:hypothetical protein
VDRTIRPSGTNWTIVTVSSVDRTANLVYGLVSSERSLMMLIIIIIII